MMIEVIAWGYGAVKWKVIHYSSNTRLDVVKIPLDSIASYLDSKE
jgi:hypothetical protein